MKKAILLAVIALLGIATAQAQEADTLSATELQTELVTMADTVVPLTSILSRPVIVGDSAINYYATFDQYALGVSKVMILFWNEKGERVRVWLRKGEEPEMIFNGKTRQANLSIKKVLE